MSTTSQTDPLFLTSRLIGTRNVLRAFLGDRYEAVIAPVREALAKLAEVKGKTVLEMALEASKGAAGECNGEAALQIIAAAVDLVEGAP